MKVINEMPKGIAKSNERSSRLNKGEKKLLYINPEYLNNISGM